MSNSFNLLSSSPFLDSSCLSFFPTCRSVLDHFLMLELDRQGRNKKQTSESRKKKMPPGVSTPPNDSLSFSWTLSLTTSTRSCGVRLERERWSSRKTPGRKL